MFIQRHPRDSRSGGFTLIEISMAMIIIGMLLVPTLQLYNLYLKDKKRLDTTAAMDVVQAALGKYVATNGRYPAPADPSIAINNTGSGQSVALPITTACMAAVTDACVTATNSVDTLADVDVLADNVYIGDVPYATLGIPYQAAIDGYGYKLKYAVTANLTAAGTFNNAWGAIEVLNDQRNIVLPAQASIFNGVRGHYVILSHGPDARGAFNLAGNITAVCGGATSGLDSENCDNDGRFRNNIFQYNVPVPPPGVLPSNEQQMNSPAGPNHFDDPMYVVSSVFSGIWSFIPNQSSITSTQNGNVQVGPTQTGCANFSCLPVTKLNVTGDVANPGIARINDELRTGRLCGGIDPLGASIVNMDCNNTARVSVPVPSAADPTWNTPANWFTPSTFGGKPSTAGPLNAVTLGHPGGGVLCGSVIGVGFRGLSGIRDYEEICIETIAISNPAQLGPTCAAGTYGVGLTATGALRCE